MNPLTRSLSFQISTVDIVRQSYRTQHLTNCSSVTSLHLPSSSSSSSSAATPLRGRPLLYIRPRTTAAAAQRDQQRSMAAEDARIAGIASAIRVIPDFPKPGVLLEGILFQDITTLLLDPKAFKDTIDLFVERYKEKGISVVAVVVASGSAFPVVAVGFPAMALVVDPGVAAAAGSITNRNLKFIDSVGYWTLVCGVEARGFIFGPPIALAIGAKFVPMRKPNKLPGEVISEEYSLEYGTDKIEMHVGAVQAGERALVIDDLIATGGTLCAAINLLERVGVNVVECACVIELPELKGRERLGDKPLFVLVSST
ncbi:hypothetical protein RHSIM_Rhsim06G0061600 [Rhododendron simsii]|uniref:adenine phosphoribosyltransferase n=1 Tax=Rhododendron simsii TaxID=118357 RepID=A0A834GTH8_RHOSS|nr:hypothetical protein RHSIM_Rhsim06G0061600 [Rhododendron simsii]